MFRAITPLRQETLTTRAIQTNYIGYLGSNPGGDEIFRLSRPVLGPTQPPVQWVLGLSWE